MNNKLKLPTGESIYSVSKADLLTLAKRLDITGRWKMNKAQLLKSIENELVIPHEDDWSSMLNTDTKDHYRRNAKVGTLVAFRVAEKLMTAKIHSINGDETEVHTKNGTKITIKLTDVLWFKTGLRWPKQIFEELVSGRDNG